MKREMAAAALLLVAGGAPAQAQLSSAQTALLRCYMARLPELDDGISDARTIGRAMLLRCHDEHRATIDSAPGVTIAQQLRDGRDVAIDGAASIVLRERVRRKAR